MSKSKEKNIKDITNIGFFIGYMKRRLEYSNFKSRKGISNRLSGLISQYKQHFKSNPFEDFINFQDKRLDLETLEVSNTGYIYFIGDEAVSMVKIGYSDKPSRRLRELQIGSPVKLNIIHKIKGNKITEEQLHRKFADCKSHGEWFIVKDDLKNFLIDKL